MVFLLRLLRLLPWMRLRPPRPPRPPARVPEQTVPPVAADEDAALDAEVMRRRVQHFCQECPPPSRTRR